jgi:hypothetical protein
MVRRGEGRFGGTEATMRSKVERPPSKDDPNWKLAEHITEFVNIVFGRRLRASRALYAAVVEAKESGYTDDEIRIAYWAAAGLGGYWVRQALKEDMSPEIVLRHKGGTNPRTGQPAQRCLDDLLARLGETNAVITKATLEQLEQKMGPGYAEEENQLLKRMNVEVAVDDTTDAPF